MIKKQKEPKFKVANIEDELYPWDNVFNKVDPKTGMKVKTIDGNERTWINAGTGTIYNALGKDL